ncbi:ribbon-helix-helix protein, CopG family [Polaromonas hydrogenivorans]|uniref:ribbon-helix-helix protein, CopG family n=1 Tax=Polaromonas hydrogenivorans TaxID=335476 RepID=UPI0039EE1560
MSEKPQPSGRGWIAWTAKPSLYLNSILVHDECMKRTNIYLTEPSVEKLQELSKQTGLSVAELIRRAIDGFLNKKK